MALYRGTIWAHATYILITAVWPLIHIESFMAVTGHKTDVWLVKTVGALLIPVALCLYMHLVIPADWRTATALGGLTALAFIVIDVYYVLTGVIRDVYLADAVVEAAFLVLWTRVAFQKNSD